MQRRKYYYYYAISEKKLLRKARYRDNFQMTQQQDQEHNSLRCVSSVLIEGIWYKRSSRTFSTLRQRSWPTNLWASRLVSIRYQRAELGRIRRFLGKLCILRAATTTVTRRSWPLTTDLQSLHVQIAYSRCLLGPRTQWLCEWYRHSSYLKVYFSLNNDFLLNTH